ncbi:MAG: ABC transporter ATP-binding protein [Halococcoides sp.]
MSNIENRAVEGDANLDGDRVLDAENVAKTYDSMLPSWAPMGRAVPVLEDATIAIDAGEIVGIVGENGAGKSTLMQILVGALAPDRGTVERSGAIGWCPQDPLLYDRLTVRETFRLFGTAYGMDDEAIADARDQYADRLGFQEFLDRRIDQLSGGNRQKINLSVALMHDPDVLLLDEPYTGFDWETYLAFWALTEELTDGGTAIAIISHFVSERDRFDRILELSDGALTDVTDDSVTADGAERGAGDV